MAHVDTLNSVTLETIASQVGKLYPTLAGEPGKLKAEATLAETLPVWFLGVDDIISGNNDVASIAQNTGRWHSQIRIGGVASAAARSIPLGGEATDWQVRQIFEGQYPQQIDREIDWVDENAAGDPLVRILEIPAYQITAFWLLNADKSSSVVVATIPETAQFLRKREVYSSQAFLDAVRKEQFVVGIQS